jgi:hypothetical protein
LPNASRAYALTVAPASHPEEVKSAIDYDVPIAARRAATRAFHVGPAVNDDDRTCNARCSPPTFAYATYGVSATTNGSLNVNTPAASTVAEITAAPDGARDCPDPAANAARGYNPTEVPTGNNRLRPVTVIVAMVEPPQ